MKKLSFLLLLCVFASAQNSWSQIETPKEKESPKEKEAPKEKEEEMEIVEVPDRGFGGTEVFFTANFSATNRSLITNEGLFADTLGERAKELGLNVWSFGIGFRSQINPYLAWQGGLSLMRNGESYDFRGTDTAFSYQTIYTYVAMPLKILYTYGNKCRVYGAAGLVPQMFFGYRQDQQFETTLNATGEETIQLKSGYNTFAMSAVFNVGVQAYFENKISLFIEPEYRYQFTNSYVKTDGLKHFANALGVNFGISYTL